MGKVAPKQVLQLFRPIRVAVGEQPPALGIEWRPRSFSRVQTMEKTCYADWPLGESISNHSKRSFDPSNQGAKFTAPQSLARVDDRERWARYILQLKKFEDFSVYCGRPLFQILQ